ncbi:MAG TPA: glycoside hydrolase family 2 protein [Polyangia bacterium]|nr:glycoside hydrolase family 2 protein [Polyangia bacterium]
MTRSSRSASASDGEPLTAARAVRLAAAAATVAASGHVLAAGAVGAALAVARPAYGGDSIAGGRDRIELAGPWTFRRVTRADAPAEPWLPATVPGCVHTDLFTNGKIGDPFYRLNEKDQQWIERESWEYQTTIRVDAATLARERIELVMSGLDTYAEVFVNGASVLYANNMFRAWRVDVKPHLEAGDNLLVIRFRSPIEEVKPAYDHLGYHLPAANDQATEMVSMWSRKAPYHYGWDWGPRFVTSGIWRPIALESWDAARLDDVQVFQDHLDANAAELIIRTRVVAARAGQQRLTVTVDGGGPIAQADVDLEVGVNEFGLRGRIDKPEFWWPNGLGPQRLYKLETTLSDGGTTKDVRHTRIGLRTIEVVHERDAAGKSFTIEVNGAPVFMKGANWIPADSFVTRMTDDRYRHLLQSAADAHMNMIRVWGGGIYEDDRFYEIADELGLLVWQDFMFACSMYPGDPAFVENVRHEAIENVRRLRNHPSLALWAGNNENEAAWKGWGWPAKFGLSKTAQDRIWRDYKQMFHQLLPSIVEAEDPGRFYTRSSPSANEDRIAANKMGWGDMHYWGVWHAENPYEAYGDNISRFMSEYGFQSFPDLTSVARYTARDTDWDIGSPVMLSHQRHPRGNALIETYMDRDFRRPKDFASFLYVGQVLQGTVIKYAAEAHRRAMGRNWGSLYWQLDDCWPVASWSGIDYYGRWKALHYFARRFFAPVLVSPIDDKGTINVWGVSDRRADAAAHLTVRLVDFGGRELARREQDIVLSANASRVYLSLGKRELLGAADPKKVALVAEISENRQPIARNVMWFEKTKDLDLPRPEVSLSVAAATSGAFAITVGAKQLARDVFLGSGAIDGFFEDNFFDLLPGESRTVIFRPHAATTLGALRAALHATTIFDSY